MVHSDTTDFVLYKLHQDLCMKLNLDPYITTTSWETFQSIDKKFALEGEKIHWLGCAIYTASQNIETPTLDTSSVVKGMGINLTSLLRHSNLSFVQFFSNITSWAKMAQLPDEFCNKISRLQSTFSVAYNTFKKYHPLFSDIFVPPVPNNQDMEASKHRNRKNRAIPCTSLKIFEFIWNLFTIMKAEEASCCTELIKSYHLLYCCIDLAFRNTIVADRKDLLNSSLADELSLSNHNNPQGSAVPCIVRRFCECDSVIKEALHMKEYTFQQCISKFIENKTLLADENDFTGMFDQDKFDQNFRNVNKAYETHLLSRGDFDERIFLAEFKRVMMEKEQSAPSWTSIKVLPPGDSVDTAFLDSPRPGSETPKCLDTPLTGRRYLGPREYGVSDKSTSEKIRRLHSMIVDRTAFPSEQLKNIFESCQNNPQAKIENILSSMKARLIEGYSEHILSIEEAQNRVDLGTTLFYKYVEIILKNEMKIKSDISVLVEKEIFYQCMFACCMEIVLHCYNFPRKFPWVLDVMGVEPIHFVKVIELIVRSNDNLFRELVKHLNRIEETVLESLVWKSSGHIWDAIEKSDQGIPRYQDTALPGHLLYNDVSNEMLLQSPGGPTASDCFQSPLSQLCRNLFPSSGSTVQIQRLLPDKDVKPVISPGGIPNPQAAALPRRTGSLSIIFRKFYYLAGVRMQHLCSNLGFTDIALRRKIWTIFEDSIRHTDLIKDRHLDQLLMCAIYVICKAGNIAEIPDLFAIIMKHYRQQPQASSSVYRNVLIERERVDEKGIVIPEEKGDLIQFYNSVYVKAMQTYAVRFQPNKTTNGNIELSPLPASPRNLVSSNMQVVGNVFVRPLEASSLQTGSTFNYYFSRSPSKDLKNINRAINNNGIQGKRLLITEDDIMPPTKRISNSKIQSLVEERLRQSSSE